jgi:hypothetical protein
MEEGLSSSQFRKVPRLLQAAVFSTAAKTKEPCGLIREAERQVALREPPVLRLKVVASPMTRLPTADE